MRTFEESTVELAGRRRTELARDEAHTDLLSVPAPTEAATSYEATAQGGAPACTRLPRIEQARTRSNARLVVCTDVSRSCRWPAGVRTRATRGSSRVPTPVARADGPQAYSTNTRLDACTDVSPLV